MKIICRICGRDLNEIFQDNMSNNDQPLCEDCYNDIESNDVQPIFDEDLGMWCPNDCSLCGGFCIYDKKGE